MSGGNPYQQQPGGFQQPQGYPQQPGGYPPQQGYQQPYGQQGPGGYQGGGMPPPPMLPTEAFGGFWIRFVALMLDGFIVGIPLAIINGIIQAVMGAGMAATSSATGGSSNADLAVGGAALGMMMLLLALYIIAPAAYYIYFESKKGGTIGKQAMGLRVVNEHGMYISMGGAFGRYMGRMLSGCLLYIGFIMAGFDPHKRGLHDKICGTYVVRKEFVNPAQLQMQA